VSEVTVLDLTPADRALDALVDCAMRWGLAKTTVDDIARAAGMSRATLYRLFPGGKSAMVQAGTHRMVTQLAETVSDDLGGASDLADALSRAIVTARRVLSDDDALQFLLEHDPAAIKAQLALGGYDQVLDAAAGAIGPALAPFAGSPERGATAAVWAARLLVSYLTDPADEDLADPAVATALVEDFFIPGFARSGETSTTANRTSGPAPTTDPEIDPNTHSTTDPDTQPTGTRSQEDLT